MTLFPLLAFAAFVYFSSESPLFVAESPVRGVLQSGYDRGASGVTVSELTSQRNRLIPFRRISGAHYTMPLLFEHKESFPHPIVLFAGLHQGKKSLIGYDYESDAIRFAIPLDHGRLSSAPVISARHRKIYFITTNRSKDPLFVIHQLDLSGKNHKKFPVRLESLFENRGVPLTEYKKRIICRTALAIEESLPSSRVYAGCSIKTTSKELLYGGLRGTTGLLLAFPLQADGDLILESLKTFETSERHENPKTGYDSGIYNVGRKVSLLDDGSLVVATGNGPVNFSLNNYGCSVLRVNPDFSVVRENGRPMAFSIFGDNSEECWVNNIDISSSGVSVVESASHSLAVSMTKEGTLFAFDPYRFSQGAKSSIRLGQIKSYTVPALIKSTDGSAVAIGQYGADNGPEQQWKEDEFLSTQKGPLEYEVQRECFGLLDSIPEKGHLPVFNYYSGDFGFDIFSSIKSAEYWGEIFVSNGDKRRRDYFAQGLRSSSQKIGRLGYLVEDKHPPKNYRFQKWTEKSGLFSERYRHKESSEKGYWNPKVPQRACPPTSDPRWQEVYQVRVKKPLPKLPKVAHATAVQIDKDLKIKKLWTHKLRPTEQFVKMHPVVSTKANGEDGVGVFAVKDVAKEKNFLLLLSTKDGKELQRIPLTKEPYFTMPAIYKDTLILATQGELLVFKLARQ